MTAEDTPPVFAPPSDQPTLFDPPPAPPTHYPRASRSPFFVIALVALVVLASALIGFAAGRSGTVAAPRIQRSTITPTPNFPDFTIPSFPGFTAPGFTTPAPVRPSTTETALIKHLSPSLVLISTSSSYEGSAGAATGMVISSSGLVLTNNHVVVGATTISARLASGGPAYSATVLGYSASADVALLQLQNAPALTPVRFAHATPTIGEAVIALGNAGGVGSLVPAAGAISSLSHSVSVSGPLGTEHLTDLYSSSAPVVPGDSGGPLLNLSGRVIAMDTAAQVGATTASAPTHSFAIPAATALAIVAQIRSGTGTPSVHVGPTAFLGVSVANPAFMSIYVNSKLLSSHGVTITGLLPDGPASSSALVPGDVITSLNGHAVTTPAQLTALVGAHAPGSKVTVGYVTPVQTHAAAQLTLGTGPAQ